MNGCPSSTGAHQLKPPTTFEEQIGILQKRGLVIENKNIAMDVLSKVNYYRFTAYLLPFKDRHTNCFKKDISFNKIYRIYEFDRKFRSLIMSAIEPIEILLRTKIAYFHAHRYGPEDRKYIARDIFNTGPEHLKSWLVCLSDLRNRCAHYMRLYFHRLVVLPKLPSGPYEGCSQRIFDVLYIMKYMYLNHKEWVNSFVRALEALVNEEYREDISLRYIGFPVNWLELLEKEN